MEGYADQQIGNGHRNGLLLAARLIAHAEQISLGDVMALGNETRMNHGQQKSLHRWRLFSFCNMVGGTGIEPVTLAV